MLVILDPCNVGIGPTPGGGFVIKITDIEGMEGIQLALPIEGESAETFIEEASGFVGKTKAKIFGLDDLKKETQHGAGLDPTDS